MRRLQERGLDTPALGCRAVSASAEAGCIWGFLGDGLSVHTQMFVCSFVFIDLRDQCIGSGSCCI